MRKCILMLLLCPAFAFALPPQPNIDSLLSNDCEYDDLRCDFTELELRIALGLDAQMDMNLESLKAADFEKDVAQVEPAFDKVEDVQVELIGKRKGRGKRSNRTRASSLSSHRAPIWGSFMANFKKCAPGCVPANYGTYGKRGNRSCHPSGRAVDVGAIICGGKTHTALAGGKFATFVSCMRGKMKTLYRDGKARTKGHHDHAHFSNGCRIGKRMTY